MKLRVAACAIGLAIVGASAVGTADAADQESESALLHEIRTATARYHSPAQAKRAGYVRDSPCETSAAGGMGFHYVNFDSIVDPAIDPRKPEVLLYAPRSNGTVELVGVEYLAIDSDQDLSTDADRPFLGEVPFAGPMPGHTAQMPIHYDLHVWLYTSNPSGMFAPWNPAVTC